MRDPYQVLGVGKSATEAEVKRAYRKLAKQWHPDYNKDAANAKDRFAEIGAAYEILGDSDKRKAFDRGEIDGDGKQRFQGFEGFGQGADARGAGRGGFGGFETGAGPGGPFGRGRPGGGFDPSEIFANLFGDAMSGGRTGQASAGQRSPGQKSPGMGRGPAPKGDDVTADLKVALEDLVSGERQRLRLATGREIEVDLPAGVNDGQTIRLRGLGRPSQMGGEPGDVLLTIRLSPHDRFTPEASNLRVRISVPLVDAVLGGALRIPTLEGEVETKIPAMTSSGRTLRLRGKGLPGKSLPDKGLPGKAPDGKAMRGDLLATLDVVLPEMPDPELDSLMQKWRGS
jgi:DnaJ-class molecular chaperone